MEGIREILKGMEAVSLEDMDSAKLMNRYDSKYRLPIRKLIEILDTIADKYYILDIEGNRIQKYNTIYYDTPEDYFYISHHNGKLGRIKIRKREYVDSGIAFLEIKKKNNKKKTEKSRMRIDRLHSFLTPDEKKFLKEQINNPYQVDRLSVKCKNTFERITLINKDFSERCTIDLNLTFFSDGDECKVSNMAIVELKQAGKYQKTSFADELKRNHIYRNGFSKYCIGRAILDPMLKSNLFKSKITELHRSNFNINLKKQNTEIYQSI